MTEKNELTGKQRAFVDAYFACRFNGTEAARRAGYGGDDNALAAAASRLLINVKVKEEIARRWKAHGMTAEEVTARLTEQARGNMEDFLRFNELEDEAGQKRTTFARLDLPAARDAGKLHLVKSLSWTKEGVRIELYSAKDALDSIAKTLGMFKDQSTNLNIDLDSLTNEQLERIANGEDPAHVLATSGRCVT